jgi:SOS-response transcriptional repressor LexA
MMERVAGESFGDFFRRLRRSKGFKSQITLALASGISQATISRIEDGTQKPQLETLKVLASTLDLPFSTLVNWSDEYINLDSTKKDTLVNRLYIHDELDNKIADKLQKISTDKQFTGKSKKLIINIIDRIADVDDEMINSDFLKLDNVIKTITNYDSTEFKAEVNIELEKFLKDDNSFIKESTANYLITADFVEIPIYGEIRAGYNSLAEQRVIGYEKISKDYVRDGEYFYLIVRGDSMIDEGIREGMRVLVKSQHTCEHGKIGVVIVNGDEGTLKRVFYDGDNVILQAANRDIPPRVLPFHEVRIQGQVKKVEFDV